MMSLDTPVEDLNRVGKSTASRLQRMGIWTVRDLLFHFPFRHEDWSRVSKVAELQAGQEATVHVTVIKIGNRQSLNRKLALTLAVVADDSGSIEVIWFGQPFLEKNFPAGSKISLSGKVDKRGKNLLLKSPKYELIKEQSDTVYTGRLLPMYPLSLNLTQRQIQFLVSNILYLADDLVDPLPTDVREAWKLPDRSTAVRNLHSPQTLDEVSRARARLAFEELFYLQLQMQEMKAMQVLHKARGLRFFEDEIRAFVGALPFELTADQKRTAWTIFQDIGKDEAMNRLVQGDVGSGKTVVAALAMYNAGLNGSQAALMAPTEVLANQHFATFQKLFSTIDLPVALFTRTSQIVSQKGSVGELTKKQMMAALANGEIALVVGTHALIQGDVRFRQLGLAVVDEQHRFGVEQRKALRERSGGDGFMPHLLSMTATPIPRTLMLALYGDLAVSSIKQKPKDRLPILTKLVYPKEREGMYEFVREQIAAGRQVYVVCPLIEESDALGVTSVSAEIKQLAAAFPECTIAALHGQLTSNEKEEIMADFKAGKTQILVATTVIEVGVDVPNATVMMIEGAERFGFSQLHQIRGRVGRGAQQSHCFLLPTQYMPPVHDRLKKFIACGDGFEVAELDLQTRGAGEMLGTQQSGIAALHHANLADTPFLERVQATTSDFLAKHKLDDFPLLAAHIRQLNEKIHLE